jgi:hypothetical protein
MLNPFQPNLRKPWLLLCTTLLVTYAIMPGSHPTLFYTNGTSSLLEALMFLLSFPLGDIAISPFFFADTSITERFVVWAIALGVGYVQWFHLFPAILKRRQPEATTLNLSNADGVAFADKTTLGLNLPDAKPADEAERPPVPQFNERGLSPLERIFRDDDAEG